MHRPLVVAVAIALAGLATPTSYLSSGDVAAAEKGDGCPGKLGSLRLTSSGVGEENANKGEAWCLYRSKDYSKNVVIRTKWLVKSASPVWLSDLEQSYCLRTDEDYVGPGQHGDKTRSGYTFPHAGDLYILAGYLATEKGPSVGRIRKVGRELVSQYAGLAATCPGAAEPGSIIDDSPSSVADSADADEDAPAVDSGITVTTIVLSGGPGEELPALGATIELPEDDQHQLVIGGLDGEVIREEYLGDQATIIGYGPMATDADGNWSVSVDVEASTAPSPPPVPASPLPSAASPGALPSEAPSSMPAPSEEPSPPPTASPLPAPSATPSALPPPEPSPTPAPTPAPALSPTPVPPPEMIGIPEAVAEYVAGLEPKAAGAVRDLTDYLGALGDELIQEGAGEVTIPASDLASLRLLAPGFVNEIRLVSGGIIVDSVVDVRVTPVIGEDGLIEFRTNRLQDRIRSHEIVKALVLALNNYVVESGGRFRTISVTPEGLTVTAERAPQE